jgi:crotonobetainyl-CoA:carnitine CoA-transferase CaiB-like acyl-CoA transferase
MSSTRHGEGRPSARPLDGTTIVDLTRVLSGPYCTMLLADMGARVIKIEYPGRGDDTRGWGPPFVEGESAYFLSINRNKESVTLNFKHPEGRRILDELLARADVVAENFRPGTLEPLGLDYQSLSERFPRLVYASISGFGQSGPRRGEAGYDAIIQAEGGLMSITGDADGPPYRLGVAIADLASGMFAAHGIVLALYARERTGRGQHVDVAMLDAVTALLTYQAGLVFATSRAPGRLGNRHPMITPYETFAAADGEFVVAVGNDDQWRRFCEVAGLQDLADDPRFARNRDRVKHYEELRPLIAAALEASPRAFWIERLTRVGVPAGSVRGIDEVLADPQIAARQMVVELTHATAGRLKQLGVPIKLSDTPGSLEAPPPLLGEHTARVLTDELGLSAADVERLRREGAI